MLATPETSEFVNYQNNKIQLRVDFNFIRWEKGR